MGVGVLFSSTLQLAGCLSACFGIAQSGLHILWYSACWQVARVCGPGAIIIEVRAPARCDPSAVTSLGWRVGLGRSVPVGRTGLASIEKLAAGALAL